MKGFFKLILPIVFFLGSQQLFAQTSANDVKATLILHFCENISWERSIIGDIKIGCYTDDEDISNILKPATKAIKIQNKYFEVEQLKSVEEVLSCQAVYYNKSNKSDFQKVLAYARDSNILLITDNLKEELFVMINIKETNNKISFQINIPNLTLAGFEVRPNLLLSGGSIIDIKAAYDNFEKQVNENKQNLDKVKLDLANTEALLIQKDEMILQKEKELNDFIKIIETNEKKSDRLTKLILNEKKLLEKQKEENKEQKIELQEIYFDIIQKQDDLTKLNENIKLLKNESDTLKRVIVNKNTVLDQQQQYISSQRKMLYLYIVLIAALILAALALIYLFILKKRHNIELEGKVAIRTQELQNKTDQYLSLFNLAPVAIWEIDMSEIKQLIDSKGLKNEDEYDQYFNTHPDFAIECFKRIRFIQINNAALKLYDINGIDELSEMYNKVSTLDNSSSFGEEFKMIFLNQQTSNYESVRITKNNVKLNVMIKWIDVSEQALSYSRVLLTMVDVTQLRKIESELIKHQRNLEKLVAQRTNELEATVEELNSTNEELYDKNQIINGQILELKSTMEHLRETQAQLIQAEKMASLGILTAGVAHEINNPLNYIMGGYVGLTKYLKGINHLENEKASFLLNSIKLGIDRASGIVKGLNQFSRNNENYNEDCEIHSVLDNCLVILHNQLKDRIDVNKNYTNQPLNIKGNIGKLHQVFINILTNANQAIHSKGYINIDTQKLKNKVIIEITDNGCGINEYNMSKITDPFFTTKDPGKGTGLGLSLTYKVIQEHKGELNFKSEIDKGTTVKIILPLNQ